MTGEPEKYREDGTITGEWVRWWEANRPSVDRGPQSEVARLSAQRDRLLEALESAAAALDHVGAHIPHAQAVAVIREVRAQDSGEQEDGE